MREVSLMPDAFKSESGKDKCGFGLINELELVMECPYYPNKDFRVCGTWCPKFDFRQEMVFDESFEVAFSKSFVGTTHLVVVQNCGARPTEIKIKPWE